MPHNLAMPFPVSRVVDLIDPALNTIVNMHLDEARRRLLAGDPDASAASTDRSRSWPRRTFFSIVCP